MRRSEIVHIEFLEHNWHLINSNFDHPWSRGKALKHMKAAMPISYCALPSCWPFEIALKKNKSTLVIPLIFQAPIRSAKEFPPAL